MMPDTDKIIKAWERCNKCNMSLNADEEGRKAYLDCEYTVGRYCGKDRLIRETIDTLKEQEERIKKRDESLEKAYEEIKWLRGMLKEQEAEDEPTFDDWTKGEGEMK